MTAIIVLVVKYIKWLLSAFFINGLGPYFALDPSSCLVTFNVYI